MGTANVRILVVEDEQIVAMDLKDGLSKMGYQVIGTAGTGETAVEIALREKPDLVLMDILLRGEMTGIDAARIIQSHIPIPIIYLTAYTDENTLQLATQTAPYGYLVKPVEDQELRTTIEVALFKFHMENELRQSQERFHTLFQQNFDALVLFHHQTFDIIEINPAAESLFQYSKEELSRNFEKVFFEPFQFQLFQQELSRFDFSGQDSFFLDRCLMKQANHNQIICSIKVKMITFLGHQVYYCSFRNITQKVKIEEESRYLQSQLIFTNKMVSIGTLASGIAHEINNPNNFIMSNTQIIQQVWEDAMQILQEYREGNPDFTLGGLPFSEVIEVMPQLLHATFEGTRRIKNIIDNLKELSQPREEGHGDWVDINRVLDFAINILQNQIKKYTDFFNYKPGENIPRFKGNTQQLEQVIINLLQNALQSLPDRSHAIEMTSAFKEENGQIEICIADQGVGMNKKVLTRIMEPFFTTKKEQGGTGLGLYISYSIIKAHNGELTFTSLPGQGTIAIIHIPAYSRNEGEQV